MIKLNLVIIALLLFFLSCRSSREVTDKSKAVELIGKGPVQQVPEEANALLQVFFATDRNLTSEKTPSSWLGTKRSSLKYGYCTVSVPRDHRMGEVERPSLWKLELHDDPDKHISLRKILVEPKTRFYEDFRTRQQQSSGKQAFIFIHGYNVSFQDAALRTAQLSYDLGFEGVPVFYSWPSQQSYSGYFADEDTVEWTQKHLKGFLNEFLSQSGIEQVHLIAHSMGNRALTQVLSTLVENPLLRERVSEIILTAPDIDVDIFRDNIAPAFTNLKKRITLYGSATDQALLASRTLRGNFNRVGDTSREVVIVKGIETIDATNVNTGFIGHSYFGDSRTLLSDIFSIIRNHKSPDDRPGLRRVNNSKNLYWEFMK